MPLVSGQRLGAYEILAPAGSGGMGEVYRARDTRLDRTVAIKVLPQHLSQDPRLRERFEREARALAGLSHPNICTIHDVGDEAGVRFLVLEYLEGETLAELLGKGPLPLARLLQVGREVAAALERAHRLGVVHRDLKPGNVILTKSGAKLLDFGLAKASPIRKPADDETLTRGLTAAGAIVGTAHYMAPEQLHGGEADARSDLFAMGAVLYEMAAGAKAFPGESAAAVIAAILAKEPRPLAEQRPDLPVAFVRAVESCLAKDPDERWQSAHDLMLELGWIATGDDAAPRRGGRRGERFAWGATVVILATMLIALAALLTVPGDSSAREARFPLVMPERISAVHFDVSPDGRYLSATTSSFGGSRIWVRRLDEVEGRDLPGTEKLRFHFWSPDSRSIAFIADGKLKRIDVEGGKPRIVCDAPGAGPLQLGAWGSDGTILFRIDEAPGSEEGLYRVPADGGVATRMRVREDTGRELGVAWPAFLPDGRRFLATCLPIDESDLAMIGVCLVELDTGVARRIIPVPSYVRYADGHLLYADGGRLMARPFDLHAGEVRGEPHPIVDGGMGRWGGFGEPNFAAASGVLLYDTGVEDSQLLRLDRRGAVVGVVGPPGRHQALRVSPDGGRLVVTTTDPETDANDLWIVELERNVQTRLTTAPESGYAVWSPTADRIAYCQADDAPPFLHVKALAGGEATVLLPSRGTLQCPVDWGADGRILYLDRDAETGTDLWVLPADGGEPTPLVRTRYADSDATFVPDGAWIAFTSDESGRKEIYLLPSDGVGEKRRVSTDGGTLPRWSRDGRELFYLDLHQRLMSVRVGSGPRPQLGEPEPLFAVASAAASSFDYDVMPDGEQFIVNAASTGSAAVTVVLNWTARGAGR